MKYQGRGFAGEGLVRVEKTTIVVTGNILKVFKIELDSYGFHIIISTVVLYSLQIYQFIQRSRGVTAMSYYMRMSICACMHGYM